MLRGIDRDIKHVFMPELAARNAATFLSIIQQYVLPDTRVLTDQWLAHLKKKSDVWNHFTVDPNDESFAICNHCRDRKAWGKITHTFKKKPNTDFKQNFKTLRKNYFKEKKIDRHVGLPWPKLSSTFDGISIDMVPFKTNPHKSNAFNI